MSTFSSAPSPLEIVPVALNTRGYDICVGDGVLAEAGARLLPLLARRRCLIVTDETVAGLYLAPLTAALDAAGIAHAAEVLPPGEATKSFPHLASLVDALLARRIERGDMLLALGGGVVGDLTGFAASILLRGIDFVQVPTTLLAQVDSAVGGKTGINTAHGKNLVGSFHQPRLVLADVAILDSLPARELRAGYAEVVKYGLLGDPAFFAWLEAHGAALLAGERAARIHAVATSCRAKAAIVAADERETGARALLNLGHSFAHALETASGYSERLLHGEAVAIGMALAFDLSARLGLCPAAEAARARRHLRAVGLPTTLEEVPGLPRDADRLLELMHQDKKVRDGRLRLVLARGIGQAFIVEDVDPAFVRAVLDTDAAA
jgi:3-dehydroquinate synthase